MAVFDQADYDVRCEWGLQGLRRLAPISDVVVIVDVLSFTTCVEMGVSGGGLLFPYRWKDEKAREFAESIGAELAGGRGGGARYSLSPGSILSIEKGAKLVLPSPNGSTLSTEAGPTPTLAGCLRNAAAVARAAVDFGPRVAVIPSGERWADDGSLRPCLEDLLGAGAIVSALTGSKSPEADLAQSAFLSLKSSFGDALAHCVSGRELIAMGYPQDVELAGEADVSETVPVMRDGAYRRL